MNIKVLNTPSVRLDPLEYIVTLPWRLEIDPPSHFQASECIPMEGAMLVLMLSLG